MATKKSFVVYHDWRDLMSMLDQSQKGDLIDAMFAYEIDGELADFEDKAMKSIFAFMRKRLDENREKYQETCQKNAENAKLRWDRKRADASVYDGKKSDASLSDEMRASANYADTDNDTDNDTDPDNDTDTDTDNCSTDTDKWGIPRTKSIREFISAYYPTAQDVRKLSVDCQQAMVRYSEEHNEKISSWKAFTRKFCNANT